MRETLLGWPRCPAFGHAFGLGRAALSEEGISIGVLGDSRGHRFPVRDGIPRVFPEAREGFRLREPLRAVLCRLPLRLVWWLMALGEPVTAVPLLNFALW